MKANIKGVQVHAGRNTANGSRGLKVTIPAGMTGAQLAKWKSDNEASICAVIEESEPVSDKKEGDRLVHP